MSKKVKALITGGDLTPHTTVKNVSDKDINKQAEVFWNNRNPSEKENETKEDFIKRYFSEYKASLKRDEKLELYGNSIYLIYVDRDTPLKFDSFDSVVTHLSIKRKDRRPCNNWRDFQEIKNAICGEEREAVQLYPSENRMTDTANQYHLWVLPLDQWFPFGWTTREVITEDVEGEGMPRQRYRGSK